MKSHPHTTLQGANGEIRAWSPCDAVFVTKVTGHMDIVLATSLIGALDKWVRRRVRDLHCFHDWAFMDNYDLSARIALTTWTFDHRARFREAHLLVRSKIVELGVEAANLAMGRFMTTHRERAGYDRALQLTLAREHAELSL